MNADVRTRTLTELLHGKGSHADPIACVEDISAELAARQVAGFPHSIGQLVFHMNYWMDYELRRIRGQRPAYPEHNSESFPAASSSRCGGVGSAAAPHVGFAGPVRGAWRSLLRRNCSAQIESVHEGDKKVAGTVEAVLWQMVAHNSYHVGQIAMMRRVLGAWPPRGGGDTW